MAPYEQANTVIQNARASGMAKTPEGVAGVNGDQPMDTAKSSASNDKIHAEMMYAARKNNAYFDIRNGDTTTPEFVNFQKSWDAAPAGKPFIISGIPGVVRKVPQLNKAGNPVLDTAGNPVYVSPYDVMKAAFKPVQRPTTPATANDLQGNPFSEIIQDRDIANRKAQAASLESSENAYKEQVKKDSQEKLALIASEQETLRSQAKNTASNVSSSDLDSASKKWNELESQKANILERLGALDAPRKEFRPY
jgi:hypothetical protein